MRKPIFIFLVGILLIFFILIFYKTEEAQKMAVGEFGGVSLTIEYATTPEMRELGLGGRERIPDEYGMLFLFPMASYHGFWMKDTLVPIDIFWLDDDLKVSSMFTDIATSTYPNVFYPLQPARYVLETTAGFARAHGIATGTPLRLQSLPSVSR
jgi:uncharacterized membrane protein (UPF0127 family)